jgi:sulfoquinovosyltransferase
MQKLYSVPSSSTAWLYLHVMHYFADSMIVVSPQIQDEFHNRGMDVDVWQKGIDAEKFSPAHYNTDMRQRMIGNRTDEPFLLLHSGRFALEKRIHLLKHVLKKLPDDVHLCLVGRGPDEGRLRNLFLNDDATKSRVTFTGYLTGTELSQAMASADTFIMQSDSETLGLVVLESLASAVPVVGVAALGVSGSINHGVTGFLCDNDDELVDSIVERVVQLKNDHTLRIRMAKAARAETLLWSVEAASDKLRNVQYKNCIANHDNRFDIKFWNMVRSSSTKKQKTC